MCRLLGEAVVGMVGIESGSWRQVRLGAVRVGVLGE